MITFEEIMRLPMGKTPRSVVATRLAEELELWAKDPTLTLDRMALLAAASGACKALAKASRIQETKPAAAGLSDNLTSLDL